MDLGCECGNWTLTLLNACRAIYIMLFLGFSYRLTKFEYSFYVWGTRCVTLLRCTWYGGD